MSSTAVSAEWRAAGASGEHVLRRQVVTKWSSEGICSMCSCSRVSFVLDTVNVINSHIHREYISTNVQCVLFIALHACRSCRLSELRSRHSTRSAQTSKRSSRRRRRNCGRSSTHRAMSRSDCRLNEMCVLFCMCYLYPHVGNRDEFSIVTMSKVRGKAVRASVDRCLRRISPLASVSWVYA